MLIAITFLLLLSLVMQAQGQDKGSDKLLYPTYITGHIKTDQLVDTLTVKCYDEFTIYRDASDVVWKQQMITHDGNFSFKLPVYRKGSYFGLYNSRDGFRPGQLKLVDYPIHPGDSIHIEFNTHETKFSGKGSEKLVCLSQIKKRHWERIRSPLFSEIIINSGNLLGLMNGLDYVGLLEMDILNDFRSQLDSFDYNLLKANIEGEIGLDQYHFAKKYIEVTDTVARNMLLQKIMIRLVGKPIDTTKSDVRKLANEYIEYAVIKAECDNRWQRLMNPETRGTLDEITTNYNSQLRDKIILEYLYRRIAISEITQQDLQNAMRIVDTGVYSEKINELNNIFGKGNQALNFAYKDSKNRTVKLSDFRGKVVIVDLWFSGCGGCISVGKALPAVEEPFLKNKDVVFLSISIDSDRALWLRSIAPKGTGYGNSSEIQVGYSHFTTKTTKYLYTGGKGSNDPFIEAYIPTNLYPHLLLIDKFGKIFSSDLPRPDMGDGKQKLITLIHQALAEPGGNL